MDLISRRFLRPPYNGEQREFPIYTREEADAEGIKYHDTWWLATPHEWVLTDDGYVAELIGRRHMKMKGDPSVISVEMTLPFTRRLFKVSRFGKRIDKARLEYGPFKAAGCGYGLAKPETWDQNEARRTRMKRAIEVFAHLYIARVGKLKRADWDKIGQMYRPERPNPGATVKIQFRSDHIRGIAMRRVKEVLTGLGIDAGTVVATYIDAAKVAKENGRARDMIEAADRLMGLVREAATEGGEEAEWQSAGAVNVPMPAFQRPAMPRQLDQARASSILTDEKRVEDAKEVRNAAFRAKTETLAQRRRRLRANPYAPKMPDAGTEEAPATQQPRTDY
jgi:hypothetical protein